MSFIIGTVITFFLVLLSIRWKVDSAMLRAGESIVRIDKSAATPWAICQLVENITRTQAWRSGIVDRERVIPGVAWRSLSTALHLAAVESDVARAETHDSLRELAAQKRQELSHEAASLHEIERRLNDVFRAALRLDEREREQERDVARSQEEAELRQRLARPDLPASRSTDDAVEVVGVQAQAEALNELLAESDKIASGLRRYN